MKTPANIAKHPIHPMLITIPIGLWVCSLVCDIVRASGSDSSPTPAYRSAAVSPAAPSSATSTNRSIRNRFTWKKELLLTRNSPR